MQLIASGALTAAVSALASGFDPAVTTLVMAGFMILTTYAQNYLEHAGIIPTLLPPKLPPEIHATPAS